MTPLTPIECEHKRTPGILWLKVGLTNNMTTDWSNKYLRKHDAQVRF